MRKRLLLTIALGVTFATVAAGTALSLTVDLGGGLKVDTGTTGVLTVSDVFRDGRRTRIADEDLLGAGLRMGELASRALA